MGVLTCTRSYVAFFHKNRRSEQVVLVRHYVDSLCTDVPGVSSKAGIPQLWVATKCQSQGLLDGSLCENQNAQLIVSAYVCTCKCTFVQVTIRYLTSIFTKNVASNLSLA